MRPIVWETETTGGSWQSIVGCRRSAQAKLPPVYPGGTKGQVWSRREFKKMPSRSTAVAQTPSGCSSISLGNKGYCYPCTCSLVPEEGRSAVYYSYTEHVTKTAAQLAKSLFALRWKCSQRGWNSCTAAPGLHVLPYVYFMHVCCSSCGEACLDNICQTCCCSNRERKDWSAFSKSWKSSYQPKDVEKWSFSLA